MARARNLKPGFFTNDALAECNPLSRLLFQGLWCHSDREGRLADRPKKIKAEILPYDNCDVEKLLNELQEHGFILRYSVDGVSYIQVLNFTKHQNPHIKEPASEIPAPDLHHARTVQEQCLHGSSHADSLNPLSITSSNNKPTPAAPAFVLPDWINPDDWNLWMKTRKGKKMIPEQMQAQIEKLNRWRLANLDHRKALNDAATAGWQGLHEPATQGAPPGKPAKFDPTAYVNQGRKDAGGGNERVIDGEAQRVA